MREVQFYLKASNTRTHNRCVFEAGLQGIKIDPIDSSFEPKSQELSPEQEQLSQKGINDALERKVRQIRDLNG